MATKKTSKKAPVKAAEKKTAAAKTETKTTVKRVVTESTAKSKRVKLDSKLPNNLINIVIAEVIGTFILTLAALFASDILSSMYVGFTLMLIITAIGGISGAHVNPAVTFRPLDNAQTKNLCLYRFTGVLNSSVQWPLSYLSVH